MTKFSSGSVVGRKGFTLVELLVVIAIIGILVGLLLPAVQAAREAARRMSCSNNMRNVALSIHNYHDAHKKLPYLGMSGWECDTISWVGRILPYIEQGALYETLGFGGRVNGGLNQQYRTTKLSIMSCPSENMVLGESNANDWCHQRASYAVCVGNSNYAQDNPNNWDGLWTYQNGGSAFRVDRNADLGVVSDGTSNTVMLSEVPVNQKTTGWEGMYAVTIYTSGAGFTGYLTPNSKSSVDAGRRCWTPSDYVRRIACHAASGSWRSATFPAMSNHTGGVHAGNFDGSTQFVSESLDIWIWRAKTSTQGNEVINDI